MNKPPLFAAEVPREFLRLGRHALPLILWSAAVCSALIAAFLYAHGMWDWSWLTIGIGTGALLAVVSVLFVLRSVSDAFSSLHRCLDHELQDDLPAEEPENEPENEPEPQPASIPALPSGVNDLSVQTSNQAQQDYQVALRIVEATLRELGKVADGELLRGKPFSFQRCNDAKMVNRWSDWNRIVKLMEDSGVGEHLTEKKGWQIHVKSVSEAAALLASHYHLRGFIRVNGTWMRK